MYVTLLPDLFHCLADLGGLLVPLSQGDKVSGSLRLRLRLLPLRQGKSPKGEGVDKIFSIHLRSSIYASPFILQHLTQNLFLFPFLFILLPSQ